MSLSIVLTNDGTGKNGFANYDVVVRVNGRIIAVKKVSGHKRSDGWEVLVKKLVEGESCADTN